MEYSISFYMLQLHIKIPSSTTTFQNMNIISAQKIKVSPSELLKYKTVKTKHTG